MRYKVTVEYDGSDFAVGNCNRGSLPCKGL